MRQVADEGGYDLADCYAYSDSITDLPMLSAVGHPTAVNPDRALRKAALAARLAGPAVHPAGEHACPLLHPADAGRDRCRHGRRARPSSVSPGTPGTARCAPAWRPLPCPARSRAAGGAAGPERPARLLRVRRPRGSSCRRVHRRRRVAGRPGRLRRGGALRSDRAHGAAPAPAPTVPAARVGLFLSLSGPWLAALVAAGVGAVTGAWLPAAAVAACGIVRRRGRSASALRSRADRRAGQPRSRLSQMARPSRAPCSVARQQCTSQPATPSGLARRRSRPARPRRRPGPARRSRPRAPTRPWGPGPRVIPVSRPAARATTPSARAEGSQGGQLAVHEGGDEHGGRRGRAGDQGEQPGQPGTGVRRGPAEVAAVDEVGGGQHVQPGQHLPGRPRPGLDHRAEAPRRPGARPARPGRRRRRRADRPAARRRPRARPTPGRRAAPTRC